MLPGFGGGRIRRPPFVWNVPEDEVNGGTLFEAEAGTELSLSNCTLTINNAAFRGEVYAIDILTDPDQLTGKRTGQSTGQRTGQRTWASRSRPPKEDTFPIVAIDFDNVIVRGQITMIHMDHAAKLWLRWDNGLLAVSGRLLDTAGVRAALPPSVGPCQLLLTRVTAHAASGICRVRLGSHGSHPFTINRSARNSVFVVDSSLPHFDVINYPAPLDPASQNAAAEITPSPPPQLGSGTAATRGFLQRLCRRSSEKRSPAPHDPIRWPSANDHDEGLGNGRPDMDGRDPPSMECRLDL